MPTSDDFYCDQVLSGRTTVHRVHETATVLAFHHTRPSYAAHVVVIPKRHIPSLLEAERDEIADMLEVAKQVATRVLAEYGATRLVTNLGRYQESKHLHWHVVADRGTRARKAQPAQGRTSVTGAIRTMDVWDAARVAELTGQLGYPVSEAELRERLATALASPADHRLLVAVDTEDRPIGWAHVERLRLLELPPAAQLAGLVVSEELRSAGLGAALLERAEVTARSWGCRSIRVRSNVVRERAHRLYERAGYRSIKTSYTFEKELAPSEPPAGQQPDREAFDPSLRDAWEAEAERWVAWARAPGHDTYWRFHRDQFLQLLPPPDGLTLDIGCGEGRFPRDLRSRGYRVAGIDASPTLIEHARQADPEGDYTVADAADLPHADASVQLVTALLSLHDMDDMEGAVREAARVLVPGGHLCAAVVHPINSAGKFSLHTPDAPFVIRESYFEQRRYADAVERDGLRMTFTSRHRPLEAYLAAFEYVGLLVERLVEVPDTTAPPGDRWQRLPLFLHIRAVKP